MVGTFVTPDLYVVMNR